MLIIWSLVPLPFLKSNLHIWKSSVPYCRNFSWRALKITFLACEMKIILQQFGHSFALHFFRKTGFFLSCDHCWVFQICWHIDYSTLTASTSRILNSSAGIPSPPLTLLVVMLPKTHLTSHYRVSGSRWVITSSWLSRSLNFFGTVLCILATFSYSLLLNLFC